jgi:hypothetical protein
MTSRQPIGKSEAYHHAAVTIRGFELSLRKSDRVLGAIGMPPPPPPLGAPAMGGGGGRREGFGVLGR